MPYTKYHDPWGTGAGGATPIVAAGLDYIETGIVTAQAAAEAAQADVDLISVGAWQDFTPTWTSDAGTPSIGNGTLQGRYYQLGKLVVFTIVMQTGSTSTYGTGNYKRALPVTAAAGSAFIATGVIVDGSAGFYHTTGDRETSTTLELYTGGGLMVRVSRTSPMTWDLTDGPRVWGLYEAA